jgi:hypothetical protein
MLKQEELAFVNAISTLELCPALLRDLWKAMPPGKRSRAGAPCKAKSRRNVASKRHPTTSSVAIMAQVSVKPLQKLAAKRKAEDLSSSD